MSEHRFSRRELLITIGAGTVAGLLGERALNFLNSMSDTTSPEASAEITTPRAENPDARLSLEEFVGVYRPYAKKVHEAYGINADVVLAQAYLETGGASSELAAEAHAFFGIKAKDDWSGPIHPSSTEETLSQEQIDEIVEQDPNKKIAVLETLPSGKKRVELTEEFRSYDTVLESFMDYGDRITNSGYYDEALEYLDEPLAYIAAISPIYATDEAYQTKLTENYKAIVSLD